jgi:uncharacterized Ntn-hydrolase superfamily protein
VGNRVPWVRAGVGAIASQADTNPELGREGLKLLASGAAAQEALEKVLAADAGRELRQLSILDARGGRAVFTGAAVLRENDWAGSIEGADCIAAGNLITGRETLEAMLRGFESSSGFLGERVLRALEAGQKAGGDKRGKVSAALILAREGAHPLLDLRIDRSDTPVQDLRVLFDDYLAAFNIRV